MSRAPDGWGQIRLIATDLDGTLLRSDGSVSARTRAALAAAQAAGIPVVIVTARPPRTARVIAANAGITSGHCICSNGALVWDLAECAVVRYQAIPDEVVRAGVVAMRELLPEVMFGFERVIEYACEPGYAALRGAPPVNGEAHGDALEICGHPVTKMLLRHPTLTMEALAAHALDHFADAAEVTYSGAGPAEIMACGVNKGSALAAWCAAQGYRADEVMACGDMPNDAPMLAWAGWSVAVANAHPEALVAARLRAASNDEDGVAQVIERVLAARGA